ncbi:MAG: hypothetical protein IH804_09450 [Planctomycetes bacterium]|nr:hypothetical protein [Planctomycetota bacterium]
MRESVKASEPKPRLQLVGEDSNALAILGRAQRAAREAGWSGERIEDVMIEAISGGYGHLVTTMIRYFDTGD